MSYAKDQLRASFNAAKVDLSQLAKKLMKHATDEEKEQLEKLIKILT